MHGPWEHYTKGNKPRSWFLTPFFSKGNQGFREKQLILGLRQDRYKTGVKQRAVPESKKSAQNNNYNSTRMGICQKDTEVNWKGFQQPKLEQFQQKNIVLDYSPKYKRNICESILYKQITEWINKPPMQNDYKWFTYSYPTFRGVTPNSALLKNYSYTQRHKEISQTSYWVKAAIRRRPTI